MAQAPLLGGTTKLLPSDPGGHGHYPLGRRRHLKAVRVPLGRAEMVGSPKPQMPTRVPSEMMLLGSPWKGLLFLNPLLSFPLARCFGLAVGMPLDPEARHGSVPGTKRGPFCPPSVSLERAQTLTRRGDTSIWLCCHQLTVQNRAAPAREPEQVGPRGRDFPASLPGRHLPGAASVPVSSGLPRFKEQNVPPGAVASGGFGFLFPAR